MQQSLLSDSHRDYVNSTRAEEQHQRLLGLVDNANRHLREDHHFEASSHFAAQDLRRPEVDCRVRVQNFMSKETGTPSSL